MEWLFRKHTHEACTNTYQSVACVVCLGVLLFVVTQFTCSFLWARSWGTLKYPSGNVWIFFIFPRSDTISSCFGSDKGTLSSVVNFCDKMIQNYKKVHLAQCIPGIFFSFQDMLKMKWADLTSFQCKDCCCGQVQCSNIAFKNKTRPCVPSTRHTVKLFCMLFVDVLKYYCSQCYLQAFFLHNFNFLIQWQKVLLRSIPWVVILYIWWKTKYTMSYLGLWRQSSYGNDTFHTSTSPLQLTLSTFQLLYCLDFSRKMWLNLSCAIKNVKLTQFIS